MGLMFCQEQSILASRIRVTDCHNRCEHRFRNDSQKQRGVLPAATVIPRRRAAPTWESALCKQKGNLATPMDEQASIDTPKATRGTVSDSNRMYFSRKCQHRTVNKPNKQENRRVMFMTTPGGFLLPLPRRRGRCGIRRDFFGGRRKYYSKPATAGEESMWRVGRGVSPSP